MGNVVQFAKVETGNMSEVPPDAPDGEWVAQAKVKIMATAKDSYPMLCIDWKLLEANTDGNENAVGGKVSEFLVFFPSNHQASRMSKIRMRDMCRGLEIEPPTFTSIESPDDLAEFVEAIEADKHTIWTKSSPDKKTGELRTEVKYLKPGASVSAIRADSDDEDEEKPVTKTVKKSTKKK